MSNIQRRDDLQLAADLGTLSAFRLFVGISLAINSFVILMKLPRRLRHWHHLGFFRDDAGAALALLLDQLGVDPNPPPELKNLASLALQALQKQFIRAFQP